MTFVVVKEEVDKGVDGKQKLTLEQFLASPESDQNYEFVDGQAVKKERLPSDVGNELCPVAPELAIEIMLEGQTFKEFVGKAGDYLNAGVLRVWVIDPMRRTLTVFYPDRPPETYRGDRMITDELFPDLSVTSEQFFVKAGI
jgi:Putative restriction endonuclease